LCYRMLPPGHIAGGYLVGKVLLNFLPYSFASAEVNQLLLMGALVGFAPDLDMFYAFNRLRGFRLARVDEYDNNHRTYISHAPAVWLIAGLAIFLLAGTSFWKTFGLLIWLGGWSHFILDSLEWGVMWLWPFNKKEVYALANKKYEARVHEAKGFVDYWLRYLLEDYAKHFTFYLEILIIITALIVLLD